jgi:hypothetical protein
MTRAPLRNVALGRNAGHTRPPPAKPVALQRYLLRSRIARRRVRKLRLGGVAKRRYLKAAAEQEAWMHSMHAKCAIAVPLVIPFASRRTSA